MWMAPHWRKDEMASAKIQRVPVNRCAPGMA